MAVVLAAQTASPQSATAPSQVTDATAERALLNQYCVTCHNQKLKTAGLELDKLDTEHVADHAEKWELVVRKLRAGMMPPSGISRPAWATYESMVAWLEG
jgi:cytochrome c551/c552